MTESFYKIRERIIIFLCEHRESAYTRNQLFYAIRQEPEFKGFDTVLSSLLSARGIRQNDGKYQIEKDVRFGTIKMPKMGDIFICLKKKRYKLVKHGRENLLDGDKVLFRVTNYYLQNAEYILTMAHPKIAIRGNFLADSDLFIPYDSIRYPDPIKTLSMFKSYGYGKIILHQYLLDGKAQGTVEEYHTNEVLNLPSIVAKRNGITKDFSDDAMNQADEFSYTLSFQDKVGRVNLTNIPFISIDDFDTTDIDDAVHLEETENGWHIIVAISDLAHYIKPSTPLDIMAKEKGCSSYFSETKFLMFPESIISACSLYEGKERLVVCIDMMLDKDGTTSNVSMYEGIVNVTHNFSYNEADDAITSANDDQNVSVEMMRKMEIVSKMLEKCRLQKSAFILDKKPGISRSIIEELMILANSKAAKAFADMNLPFFYRSQKGITLKGLEMLDCKDQKSAANCINKASDNKKTVMVTIAGQNCEPSRYSIVPEQHILLGVDCYCRFTSPLRSYADLITQRLILKYIHNKYTSDAYIEYLVENIEKFGEQCTYAERRSRRAAKEYRILALAEKMQKNKETIYTGVIYRLSKARTYICIDEKIIGFIKETGKKYRIGETIPVMFNSVLGFGELCFVEAA